MEERHSDDPRRPAPPDHRTAQAGQPAGLVAVLTGARLNVVGHGPSAWSPFCAAPWDVSPLPAGARALGRDAAVAGHAAEGVMHALAELSTTPRTSPRRPPRSTCTSRRYRPASSCPWRTAGCAGEVQLRRAQGRWPASRPLGGLTGTPAGLSVVGRLSAATRPVLPAVRARRYWR
ncbi:hypothetical protein LV779_07265 [Streptomyces thinghirensis]|nr:hypothetical protein [Streptomyces thinghirensis]